MDAAKLGVGPTLPVTVTRFYAFDSVAVLTRFRLRPGSGFDPVPVSTRFPQPTSDGRRNKTSTSPTVKVAKQSRIFTVLRRVLLQYLFCTSDRGMRAQTAVFDGPSARREL
jgi:hypothetical protein